MAGETTTSNRDFNVQQLAETIQGVFANKTAFMGSILVSGGAVAVNDQMPYGADYIGNTITIPYFGVIGEFQANDTDGNTITPVPLNLTSETATVHRQSLGFEVTRWARYSGPLDADPYVVASTQVLESANRAMDSLLVTEAMNTPLIIDKYNSSLGSAAYMDWDLMVDGCSSFRDFDDDIVAMVVHSRTLSDMYKLKDSTGMPLMAERATGVTGNIIRTFRGVPIIVSNRVALTGSTMGTVTSAGTSPPTITINSGTVPNGAWNLKVKVGSVTGARGTWTLKFSTDGGNTYSAEILSAASVTLTDTAPDSLVGTNGTTGIILDIASGSASSDNTWTSTANLKMTSFIVQKQSMAFWYNRRALGVGTVPVPLKDSVQGAIHLYAAPKLYRRRRGGPLPGVVAIRHNVRNYVG